MIPDCANGFVSSKSADSKIFTIVMSSIAAVSLLVGGIGIMNIMLAPMFWNGVVVDSNALGARRRDVVEQFLPKLS